MCILLYSCNLILYTNVTKLSRIIYLYTMVYYQIVLLSQRSQQSIFMPHAISETTLVLIIIEVLNIKYTALDSLPTFHY